MNEENGFIEEVTADLRQERLYKVFRRYAWVAILLVLLIVGGTAWNEYRKASALSAAKALGEQVFVALEMDDSAKAREVLSVLGQEGDIGAVIALIILGLEVQEASRGRLAELQRLANDSSLDSLYRDLARLGWVMAASATVSPLDRLTYLEALSRPGAPFRVLAKEQRALILIEIGKRDEALNLLRATIEEDKATEAFIQRSEQLIIALGEDSKLSEDTGERVAQ